MIVIKKEVQYLNITRIVAINLVIMLHCISPHLTNAGLYGTRTWLVCDVLSSFVRMGVPLFFAISGYLLLDDNKTQNIKDFYKSRLSRILIPFFVWDIIYFVVNRIAAGQSIDVGIFFSELMVHGSKYHLWYVYSLLGIYLLAPFLKRVVDTCTEKQLVWFLIVILLPVTIFRFFNIVTPFYIYLFGPLVEGYVGFFILGYILGKYEQSETLRNIIYLSGLAGVVIGIAGNYLASSSAQINVIFNEGYSITQYLTTSAFFIMMKNFTLIKSNKADQFLSSLSKITYGIYLSHVLVLNAFNQLFFDLSPARSVLIGFVVTSSVSTAAMFVFSKIKYVRNLLM